MPMTMHYHMTIQALRVKIKTAIEFDSLAVIEWFSINGMKAIL